MPPASKAQPRKGQEDGIEVDEEIRFQHLSWRVQRIGWGLIAATLVAGAFGLLGLGPVARRRILIDATLEVEYYRIARRYAPLELRFRARPTSADTFTVGLSQELLDRLEIQRIDPEPAATVADSWGTNYQFAITAPTHITFHVEPNRAGRIPGRVRTANGPAADLPLVVLP